MAELRDEAWLSWFGATEIAEALTLPDGESRQATELGGLQARHEYGHVRARCAKCRVEAALDRIDASAAAGGYRCGCGEQVSVRRAPPLAEVIVPGARFVVGEGALGAEDEPVAAREPVLFQCMGCGGSLKVDGRERSVRCTFCSADNFLPDGLWLRLHPPRVVRPFFVLADATVDGQPSAALLERLAGSDSWTARQAVAGNPRAPAHVLASLVADSDSDVRKALAANPACPESALDALSSDSDSDVRAAICRRADLSPGIVRKLLADEYYRVRAAAAGHPRASVADLVALAARETDSDVLDALGARDPLPAQVLAGLAGSDGYRTRQVAARHPGTPVDALRKLAVDHDDDVLEALVGRAALPDDVAVLLAGRAVEAHATDVQQALLRRSGVPEQAVRVIAGSHDDDVAALARAHPTYAAARSRRTLRTMAVAGAIGALLACVGVLGGGGLALLVAAKRVFRHLF